MKLRIIRDGDIVISEDERGIIVPILRFVAALRRRQHLKDLARRLEERAK